MGVCRRVPDDLATLDGLAELANLFDGAAHSLANDLPALVALLLAKLVAKRGDGGDVFAVEEVSRTSLGRLGSIRSGCGGPQLRSVDRSRRRGRRRGVDGENVDGGHPSKQRW